MKIYIHFILSALLISSCVGRNNQGNNQESIKSSSVDRVAPVERTTVSYATTDYKYVTFGSIGYDSLHYSEDTLSFPPIDGLSNKTASAFCPKDTCYSDYAVLALRCPDNKALLSWMAGKVRQYVDNWPIGYPDDVDGYNPPVIPVKDFSSAEEICSYYMGWLQVAFDKAECPSKEDPWHYYQQQGLLLADCWQSGDVYTFYEIFWDNQNNMPHEAYHTVSSKTGKELGLEVLVDPSKYDELFKLALPRLINGNGDYYLEQYYDSSSDGNALLLHASGCGLIEEGLILYYFPYNLGSGADGEYEAIVPYEELEGILKDRKR